MNSFHGDSLDEASSVHQLLEEGWFYGDILLNARPRMLRCYSDPTPNFGQQSPASEKTPPASKSSAKLSRAPSLPPCIGSGEKIQHRKGNGGVDKLTRQMSDQALDGNGPSKPLFAEKKTIHHGRRKMGTEQSIISSTNNNHNHRLVRSPSLPHNFGREEDVIQANESDITMSILIRQAMPNSSDMFPRRRNSLVMPRYRPPRNPDMESAEKTKAKCPNPRALQKGWKELRLDLEKQEELVPTGLQGGKGSQEKEKTRRHVVQSCYSAPPTPIWEPKNTTQDMKAQLKFWARAVASNVR